MTTTPQPEIRPLRLADYHGQPAVTDRLAVAIEAARLRHQPLDHVLAAGPAGLGKTTLAGIVAAEQGGQLTCLNGASVRGANDAVPALRGLKPMGVLFVDEIHSLPRKVQEILYTAAEDRYADIVVDDVLGRRNLRLRLPAFTLVGATTDAGKLTGPMRDRFGLTFDLDFYAPADLADIVKRSAGIMAVSIGEDAALELASRSRGTPRIVNRLLRRAADFAAVKGNGAITLELARQTLSLEGIDERGLTILDRRYLDCLRDRFQGGPAGLESIASALVQSQQTLETQIEPYLMRVGVVIRTRQGRKLGIMPAAAKKSKCFNCGSVTHGADICDTCKSQIGG